MTVKQLKEKLEHFPDEMDVFFAEVETGFYINPVETVESREVNFSENEEGSGESAMDTVVVLDGI